MATRKFEIETPLELLHRWAGRADQLKASMFQGGVQFTWDDFVKVQSPLLVREGEWVGRDPADGKWIRQNSSVRPSAFPVFLDPGAPRTDHEGGITVLRGGGIQPITVRTNMVGYADDALNVRAGSELVVGALPAGHDFEGEYGLVPLNEKLGATEHYVVAVVEEVLGDGMYRVTTVSYFSNAEAATSVP